MSNSNGGASSVTGAMIKIGKVIMWIAIFGTGVGAWLSILDIRVFERFSPFRVRGEIGRPVFGLLEGTSFPTIAVSVSFANVGRQRGCVVDIALRLKAKAKKTEWTFFPAKYLRPEMYYYPMQKRPELAIESPPAPVRLQGGEAARKAVLFVNRPVGSFPVLEVSNLEENEVYELNLSALTSDYECKASSNKSYTNIASDEVELKGHLADIKRRMPVEVLPLELDTIRKRFVEGKPG